MQVYVVNMFIATTMLSHHLSGYFHLRMVVTLMIVSLIMLSGLTSTLAGEKPFYVNLFCCTSKVEKPLEKPCKVM